MTNKLTLSDCMKYPNAKVKWDNSIYDIAGINCVTNRVWLHKDKNMIGIIKWQPAKEIDVPIADCKLILREITQLTDEGKQYINDNYVYELFKNAIGENNWNSFNELFAVCENKLGLINYLREKNIMIEPEDLFKQGKAVKDV